MLVPVRCPICTAIGLVTPREVIETATSRLFRCPSCRFVVSQAVDDDPPLAPDGRGPTATEHPTGPTTPPAGRP